MDNLFTNAPGFDQPLAVLKHCHDRIRKQLATLDKLLAHLPAQGADEQARQAAYAVLRYFTEAAPLHHEDEEIDLLPSLEACAQSEDAALLQELLPRILQQHAEMAIQWANLERQLKAISLGVSAALLASDVAQFKEIYLEHMQTEETQIAPMAKRIFSTAQMSALGKAMQERRGIPTSA